MLNINKIMDNILNCFTNLMTQTLEIYEQQNAIVNTVATKSWVLVDTVINSVMYEGSSANAFVSEKFKAQTDAVIIINPNNLSVTIEDSYRLDIQGRKFLVVHADNIMGLNEVIAVAVKEDKTNGV